MDPESAAVPELRRRRHHRMRDKFVVLHDRLQARRVSAEQSGHHARILITTFAVVFIDICGACVIFPVLPDYIKSLGVSTMFVGYTVASYNLAAFISTLVVGRISDAYGRKVTLLIALFTTCVGSLLSALVTNIYGLMAVRFFAGLGGSSPLTAQAIISDIVPQSERPKYLSFLGLSTTLAFTFGPLIGSALVPLDITAPFYFASATALIALLVAVFTLDETQPALVKRREEAKCLKAAKKKAKRNSQTDEAGTDESESTLDNEAGTEEDQQEFVKVNGFESSDRPQDTSPDRETPSKMAMQTVAHIALICFVFFLCQLAFCSFTSYFPIYAAEYLAINTQQIGLVFGIVGGVVIFVNALIYPYLVRNLELKYLMLLSMLLLSIGLAMIPVWKTNFIWLVFLILMVVGYAGNQPTAPAMLASFSNEHNVATILGYGQTASALALVVSPLMFGAVYTVQPDLTYYLAGAISGLGFLIYVAWELGVTLMRCGAEKAAAEEVETEEVGTQVEPSRDCVQELGDRLHRILCANGYRNWPQCMDSLERYLETCFPPVSDDDEERRNQIQRLFQNQEDVYAHWAAMIQGNR